MTYHSSEFASHAVHAGHVRTHEGENAEAIFATSSYVFANAAQAAERFQKNASGNVYSRFTNPTVRTFEQRLAALEGASGCVATASGMAAILAVCTATLKAGDHVLASSSLFGSTVQLFKKYLARMGNTVEFARIDDVQDWRARLRPSTRLLFVETPSNPLTQVADIAALAQLARSADAMLVVDNCFCTPALQRPIELGADIVIHSATKYLDGQGRCVGGAVVSDRRELIDEVFAYLRCAGPCMSPFNAWVFLKGLETLELRMQRHCSSAAALASWLQKHPAVTHVYYPGRQSHPQHALCARQQSGFGGMVSFEVSGGREAAWRVVDAVQMISITANLGDAKSTITHPATTTHGRLSECEREAAGIAQSLLRVSVGLESVDDIIVDLQRGLAHC